MHKTAAIAATKCPCGYEKCDAGGDEKLKIKFMWPKIGISRNINAPISMSRQ